MNTNNRVLSTSRVEDEFGLSFIIITYERPELLLRTFKSIEAYLHYGNVEILICDDHSVSNKQKNALNELRRRGCKVLVTEKNSGLGSNANMGLRNAKFPVICQLQDDFILSSQHSQKLLDFAKLLHTSDLDFLALTSVSRSCSMLRKHLIYDHEIRWYENDLINKKIVKFERPYSDQPHLKTKVFINDIGEYIENASMVLTELEYKFRVSQQKRHYICSLDVDYFTHIGQDNSLNPFNRHFSSKHSELYKKISWFLKLKLEIFLKWR